MQSNPLPEAVHVTIFMEGLRTGVARTEVFRVHPSTFEEAVRIALIAEHNFKSARLGWNGYNPSSARANSTSTPAGDSQNRWISAMLKMKVKLNFKLLSSNVLQRQATSQHSTPSQKSGMARGNADTQYARGALLGNN
uniref:Uncharacterized protein n=1 Tax=Hyaloperonospora arabidopsidis (strain Emoy2) TaxID=559515 RepID=M4C3W2_HYAAE